MAAADVSTGPGVYGPRTEVAVKRFQEAAGLPATGVAGPSTLLALAQGLSKPKAAPKPAAPTPPTDSFTSPDRVTSTTHKMLAPVPSRTVTEDTETTATGLTKPEGL